VRFHCLTSTYSWESKANGIELNRKVLADLAMNHPEAFKAVLKSKKRFINSI
jgi:large subunit ribosomal protein L20